MQDGLLGRGVFVFAIRWTNCGNKEDYLSSLGVFLGQTSPGPDSFEWATWKQQGGFP